MSQVKSISLHDSGLLETFAIMDRRRLERFSSGRTQAKSSRSSFLRSIGLFMLLLMFLTQVTLNSSSRLAQILRTVWVTLALLLTSGILVVSTVLDCFKTKDHVFSKLGLCVFSICALWYLRDFEFSRDSPFVFSEKERNILAVFAALEIFLLLGYLCIFVLYANLGRLLSKHRLADKLWYRFQRESEVSFAYSPYGILGKRQTFEFEGERNADGRPHGLGTWRDDSSHGEILRGNFCEGVPRGFFQSREKSSEALFVCHPILIATSRAEDIGNSFWYPRRDSQGLRFGIADVECCYGSTYYRNLPAVRNFQESRNLLNIIDVFENYSSNVESESTSFRVERVDDINVFKNCNYKNVNGIYANNTLYVKNEDLEISVNAEKEALVFFHGFNCPVEFAACKLAQLLALGKFPKNIVPFVFSQSAGQALSYFPVLRELPTFAKDAAEFLKQLRDAGFSKIHLLGHSMGCDLLLQTFKNLAESDMLTAAERGTPTTYRPGNKSFPDLEEEARPLMEVKNVMLLNADVDVDLFVEAHLENLQRFAALTTILVDRNDRALWFGELGQNKKKIGCMQRTPWVDVLGIDIIDTTDMQHNVHSMRHSYFNLNMQIVADLDEILSSGKPAAERRSLVCRGDGAFAFLCPPAFITADRARA